MTAQQETKQDDEEQEIVEDDGGCTAAASRRLRQEELVLLQRASSAPRLLQVSSAPSTPKKKNAVLNRTNSGGSTKSAGTPSTTTSTTTKKKRRAGRRRASLDFTIMEFLPPNPSTVVTTSLTPGTPRKRFSAKLMDTLSVFEVVPSPPIMVSSTTITPVRGQTPNSSTAGGGGSTESRMTDNEDGPILRHSVDMPSVPVLTPSLSLSSSSDDGRRGQDSTAAIQLIQRFNQQLQQGSKVAAGGSDHNATTTTTTMTTTNSKNSPLSMSSTTHGRLQSPRGKQVQRMVRRLSLLGSSSSHVGSSSKHGRRASMPTSTRTSTSCDGDDDDGKEDYDDLSDFGGEGDGSDHDYRHHDQRPEERQELLGPREVKALIRARTQSDVFQQLVISYEDKLHQNRSSRNFKYDHSAEDAKDQLLSSQQVQVKKKWKAKQWAKSRHRNFCKQQVLSPPPDTASGIHAAAAAGATAIPIAHMSIRAEPLDMDTFVPAKFEYKTEEQRNLIEATVEKNFVFSEFRRSGGKARMETTMATLFDAFQPIEAKAGETLVSCHDMTKIDDTEEQVEEHFYIVQEGFVDIEVNGVVVGTAAKGDCLGEQALLHQQFVARNMTLKAGSGSDGDSVSSNNHFTTRLLRLDHNSFRGIMQSHATHAMEAKRNIIQGIDFLKPILEHDIDHQLLNKLASLLTRQEFAENEQFMIDEGESFHVVQLGSLHLTDGNWNLEIGPGDHYGELALFGTPSIHLDKITMTGTSDGVFYCMTRAAMERALGENRLAQLQDYNAFTKSLPLQALLGMNDDDRGSEGKTKNRNRRTRKNVDYPLSTSRYKNTRGLLADRIRQKRFEGEGQDIVKDDDAECDDAVYVVREGQVLVKYTDTKGNSQEKTVRVGEVFGHEHLADVDKESAYKVTRPSSYSAHVAGGGPVSVGVLSIKDMLVARDNMSTTHNVELHEQEGSSKNPDNEHHDSLQLQQKICQAVKLNVGLNDLEKISVLGEGQYGEVWLVESHVFQRSSDDSMKQRFALKSQFKRDDTRGGQAITAIRSEIELLESLTQTICPHPGIVNLVNTYEDDDSIYMLMGLIPGGELWSQIHREDSFSGEWHSGIPEATAKFYTFVLTDTLGFMHSQNILFRDLKPENIMLDDDGYPILVDFGFAKRVADGDKTFTFCGTPNYVAPEIILHSGHDKAVDYWALGVTLYEMVSGENPFYYDGMDQVTLYDTIVREPFYKYSIATSSELLDLTFQLLEKEPNQRIGSLAGGFKDILNHQWFNGLDVNKIRTKQLKVINDGTSSTDVLLPEPSQKESFSPSSMAGSFLQQQVTKNGSVPSKEHSTGSSTTTAPTVSTNERSCGTTQGNSVVDDDEACLSSEQQWQEEQDGHESCSLADLEDIVVLQQKEDHYHNKSAGNCSYYWEGSCSLGGFDTSSVADDNIGIVIDPAHLKPAKPPAVPATTTTPSPSSCSRRSILKVSATTSTTTTGGCSSGQPNPAGTPEESMAAYFQSLSSMPRPDEATKTTNPCSSAATIIEASLRRRPATGAGKNRMDEESVRRAIENRKALDSVKQERRLSIQNTLQGLGILVGSSSDFSFHPQEDVAVVL